MSTAPKIGTSPRGILSLESPELLEILRCEISRRKKLFIRMSGSSMRPTIEEGDLMTVVPTRATTLRVRDIVIFATESDTALIHRLVKVTKRDGCVYGIARGDNSEMPGLPFPLTRAVGQVIAVQRKASKKIIALHSGPRGAPGNFITLLLWPACSPSFPPLGLVLDSCLPSPSFLLFRTGLRLRNAPKRLVDS